MRGVCRVFGRWLEPRAERRRCAEPESDTGRSDAEPDTDAPSWRVRDAHTLGYPDDDRYARAYACRNERTRACGRSDLRARSD